MNNPTRIGLLAALAVIITLAGCSSSRNTERELNMVHAQIAAITDELVRIDESLQATRASLQDIENQRNEVAARISSVSSSAAKSGGIYRTPSGFELPSLSVQRALKNAGYYSGRIDGKIGAKTKSAVKAFQRDNGLEADGVVGRNTWAKLKVYEIVVK